MIRLHHVPQSRSMRVLWLLEELGLPYELVTERFDKSLRREAYLTRSPAGRVPALEIGGETMFESGAILEYLCELYPDSGLGRLCGDAERRDFLVWLHFAETMSHHGAALTQQHLMLREDAMRSPIIMQLEAARLGKCFEAIEARLAQSGDYLLQGFSAADIAVGQAVYIGRHFRSTEGLEHLQGWYERITAREAFQRSLPDEGERLCRRDFYPAWDLPEV
ncbi:glutathione S-transferase family protein [Salipiger sp. PrR002]|uniref:glutathione S-transferase family protein n=1 Tax=Salipiger sp. PrR002 TaxID=2706489 RepID=UPI0013BAF797|nr:glutathione S-transferase family protein [Salipiger sp. PrR002]NDV97872.1 glutathione S-transferase family protein [Salipiger sp. PrR002]NDW55363.1 glutathione S-transferase family protein [Salipiger sp. PrR004]